MIIIFNLSIKPFRELNCFFLQYSNSYYPVYILEKVMDDRIKIK